MQSPVSQLQHHRLIHGCIVERLYLANGPEPRLIGRNGWRVLAAHQQGGTFLWPVPKQFEAEGLDPGPVAVVVTNVLPWPRNRPLTSGIGTGAGGPPESRYSPSRWSS